MNLLPLCWTTAGFGTKESLTSPGELVEEAAQEVDGAVGGGDFFGTGEATEGD